MQDQSRRLKDKLTDMLSWFHDFCQENGLRYYLAYGTLIGAMRHQGFIPWDDDLDVCMPRPDYDRLIELTAGKSYGPYLVESPYDGRPDYLYPFAKVYDTRTTLVENLRIPVKRGIYIDIFPLDGGGRTPGAAKRHFSRLMLRFVWYNLHRCGVREGRSFLKNMGVKLTHAMPGFLYNEHKAVMRMEKLARRRPYEQYDYVGMYVDQYCARKYMPRSYFGEPKEYEFEGRRFWGPAQGADFLERYYGDWRQLPPEDKRVSVHDYELLDLDRSYLEP